MSEGENLKLRLWRGVIIDDYQVLGITLLLSDRERVGTKKKKKDSRSWEHKALAVYVGFETTKNYEKNH